MSRSMGLLWLPLLIASPAPATIWHVNPAGTGDFATIQAALYGASSGDIIELADGTYTGAGNRELSFGGRAIILRSESGNPGACIIDCQASNADPARGFNFGSGDGPGTVLRNLTIKGGYINGC